MNYYLHKRTLVKIKLMFFILLSLLIGFIFASGVNANSLNYIFDYAGVLNESQIKELNKLISNYEKRSTVQMVGVISKSLDGVNIDEYCNRIRKWGIGQLDVNNGAFIVLALKEKQIRIEVANGLNWTISNFDASIIINEMQPSLREGSFYDALVLGFNKIIKKTKDISWNIEYNNIDQLLQNKHNAIGKIVSFKGRLKNNKGIQSEVISSDGHKVKILTQKLYYTNLISILKTQKNCIITGRCQNTKPLTCELLGARKAINLQPMYLVIFYIALAIFTWFWLSKEKKTTIIIASLTAFIISFHPIIVKLVYPLFKSKEIDENSHILMIVAILLLTCIILYSKICLSKKTSLFNDYITIVLLLIQCYLIANISNNDLFVPRIFFALFAGLFTICIEILTKKLNNLTLFKFCSVIIIIVWASFVIFDPFISGYYFDRTTDINPFLKSILYDIGWLLVPLLFFMRNIEKRGYIFPIKRQKFFYWVFLLYVSSIIIKEPLICHILGQTTFAQNVLPFYLTKI